MDVTFVTQKYELGQAYQGMNMLRAKFAPGYDFIGEFVAFDPVTGKRRWEYHTKSGAAMTASALATAGGVVFGGTADRYCLRSTRNWETAVANAAERRHLRRAHHFEVGGRQYVAVGAGGRIAARRLFYAGLTNVDIPLGTGMIWVFALPQ